MKPLYGGIAAIPGKIKEKSKAGRNLLGHPRDIREVTYVTGEIDETSRICGRPTNDKRGALAKRMATKIGRFRDQ